MNDWVLSLDEETFIESLPLFRRVFSSLDKMERHRLMAAILDRVEQPTGFRVVDDPDLRWPEQLQRVVNILKGRPIDE